MKSLCHALRIFLCLFVFLCLPVSAQASTLGTQIGGYDSFAAGNVGLNQTVFWTGAERVTEHYLTYTPNTTVSPIVVWGSKVTNYGSFSSMAALAAKQGYTVLAGINGDFFNTSNNQPLGVIISDGLLRTSCGGYSALGFYADGTAVISKPVLSTTITAEGLTYALRGINKARGDDYLWLFTEDYANTVDATKTGTSLILSVLDGGDLTADCELTLRVDEVYQGGQVISVPAGKLLLTCATGANAWYQQAVTRAVGDEITLKVSSPAEWHDVVFAVGAYARLVEGGAVAPGLSAGTAPRTAVGVKEDGTVVLYTVDGRQSGYSAGATLTQVAERLIELGCVDACLMDGGGSTTLNAARLGESAISQINRPSDGSQRSVTDYIMLATKVQPSDVAAKLALYPAEARLLKGARTSYTVRAADENGLVAPLPAAYSFDGQGLGKFDGKDVFTATTAGSGNVLVSSEGLTDGQANVVVVETPDSITVKSGSTAVTSLSLTIGYSMDLSAVAVAGRYILTSSDDCFSWQTTGGIATVDQNGVLKATAAGEGWLNVSAGNKKLSIPLTTRYASGQYADVKESDWYYQAVLYCGEKGLMTGVGSNLFSPKAELTRAMLVQVLWRLAGSPQTTAANPFGDAKDSWYQSALCWAAENKIVTGMSATSFAPGAAVTREQFATFLYRFAAYRGKDTAASATALSSFTDNALVSSWALSEMRWAVEKGLFQGRGKATLAPQGTTSRAEAAQLLMNYHKAGL